jgi:hypothetical protein
MKGGGTLSTLRKDGEYLILELGKDAVREI